MRTVPIHARVLAHQFPAKGRWYVFKSRAWHTYERTVWYAMSARVTYAFRSHADALRFAAARS